MKYLPVSRQTGTAASKAVISDSSDVLFALRCSDNENMFLQPEISLANQKETTEYQEVIQATEDLESPVVGFVKTSDYKGGLAIQVNAVIKQNNTLLYLAINQRQKLIELEEKLNKLQQEVHTLIEQEPANLENSISSLAKRLDNFSISGNLPVKRTDEQIYVFEDQSKIFKEQFGKESKKWLLEGLTSSTEVLHKQNFQLKKTKSVDIE
ncbi:hypothetical protein Tco_1343169 [Tanacetum coccineum]